MSRHRAIYFDLDDRYFHIDFGTYALLMYYAKSLNNTLAKMLFDSTISEYFYRIHYELNVESLDEDSINAHFLPSEVQEIVSFIDNDLIPALKNEPQYLFVKYTNFENFFNMFYTDMGFLDFIGIFKDDYYDDDPEQIILYLERISAFMQKALLLNKPYNVFVN